MIRLLYPILLAFLLAGCAAGGYPQRSAGVVAAYAAGDFAAAARRAERLADAAGGGPDALVAQLELGTALRAAGEVGRSAAAFDRAEIIALDYDGDPEIKLARELAAAVGSPAVLDYRGTQYDRILLSAYQAMNHLELGQWPAARKWLRRAANRQLDAADRYRGQIDARRERLTNRPDLAAAYADPRLRSGVAAGRAKVPDLIEYRDFQNPLVDYLTGVVFTATGDPERGRAGFRRAAGMVPSNPYLPDAADLAEAASAGREVPQTTFVVYEAGLAPSLDQFRVDVPLVLLDPSLRNAGVPGIALPTLAYGPASYPRLSIDAGRRYETERLVSIDGVVTSEFDAGYGLTLAKTLTIAAAKATAAYLANRGAEQLGEDVGGVGGALINLGAKLGTAAYQLGTNVADRRSWRTLPKEVQVAHFPTPPGREVVVRGAGGPGVRVKLSPGRFNVLFVRSPTRAAGLAVREVGIPAGAD